MPNLTQIVLKLFYKLVYNSMEKSSVDWAKLESFVDSSVEVGHFNRVELAERLQIPVTNR